MASNSLNGKQLTLDRLARALAEAEGDPVGAETPVNGVFLEVHGPIERAREVFRQYGLASSFPSPNEVCARLNAREAAPDTAALPSDLSDRDQRVMKLLVDGLSNKEIGYQLNIPEPTVKRSVQRIFARCGVRTRAQVVRAVMEHRFEVPAGMATHG